MRCYFNVRSKADISQFNRKLKVKNKYKKVKTDMLRSSGKQSRGIREVSPGEEKESYGRK